MPHSAKPIIIIPSRLAATRLPNKPLADINGKSMIVRAYDCAVAAGIGPVIVAAGDQEIADAIVQIGGDAVLTDPNLPSGSDRIWAALNAADPHGKHNIIINLQGDLPQIAPDILRSILRLMEDEDVDIGTAAVKITDTADILKPNVVKIAMSFYTPTQARAHYFSRSAIPHGAGDYYHHIGIYAYRRKALEKFVQTLPGTLEVREKLEQLRALELGLRIDVAQVTEAPITVDTPEDLESARILIR